MWTAILHVVEIGNFTFFVPNDREGQVASRDLINILDPSRMAFHCVRRKADQLDAALGELGLELREGAKLRCAYWRVVLGMREENDPIVADEFVEVDLPLSSFGVKVGSDAAETEGLGALFSRTHGVMTGLVPCTLLSVRRSTENRSFVPFFYVYFVVFKLSTTWNEAIFRASRMTKER
jgi:hypothetical protein